jgi:membrane-associated phospholipid phosphatase
MRLAILCALLSFALPARAEQPFAIDWKVEAPVVATGAALWIASEGLKPFLAPSACRLCGRNALDGALQEGLRWQNIQPARRLSDALLFGIVPGFALGSVLSASYLNGDRHSARENVLALSETLVLAAGLTQITKYSVGRGRPFLRTQRENGEVVSHGPDDNLSFFSGHTSITFALAVGAGSIASMRGYKQAPWIWAIGVPLAALTGYLRIAADRHYFTDVLTGALVGSAVGVLIPWLHRHYARGEGPRVSAGPPGMLTFSWLL